MRAAGALLVVAATVATTGGHATADEWRDDEETPLLEGTVEGRRRRPAVVDDVRVLDGASRATATPEEGLEALMGVHLVRAGGPLAPARLHRRGLGGARLGSDLMGLRLDDPSTGELDVASLPLWAVTTARASAGGLEDGLHFDGLGTDTLRARLGVGTLETLRLDVASHLIGDGLGDVTVGASAGTTSGDFRYAPSSPTGSVDGSPPVARSNNDQRRASGLVHGASSLALGGLEAIAWGSAHEGGIPGFATAPTNGLRGRTLIGGARTALSATGSVWSAEADASLRASSRATWDDRLPTPDEVAAVSTSIGALVETDALLKGLRLRASTRLEHAEIVGAPFVRDVVDLKSAAELRLFERWLLIAAELGGASYSDVGLLPRGAAGVELSPTSRWATGVRVTHGGRAPTLDELYAPRGLVLGNASLGFERASDVEIYGALSSHVVSVRVAGFAGRMEDAILFLNRNAFEVQPVNTGPVLRAGVEGRVNVEPHPLAGLEVTASALASRVDVTAAPLPVVPPLSARLSARLGERAGAGIYVVMHQRAAVTNNLYGTLRTPGYVLVDLISRLPLGDALAFTAALTNAFDVLDARDANLLPLPGRQLFVALEVRL